MHEQYSGYPPHHAPPKKSSPFKAGLLGCFGVFVAVLILGGGCAAFIGMAGSGDDTDTGGSDSEAEAGGAGEDQEKDDGEKTYAVGDTFEHGNFEFTVHSVEEGVGSVEDEFGLVEEPKGQYVIVDITAENISSSAEWLEGSNQVLMDGDGNMYEYDINGTVGDTSLFEEVNPGTTAEAQIAYDVPEDVELSHMLVNGATMFDDGVRVDLE